MSAPPVQRMLPHADGLERVDSDHRVVVVGGGIAGVAAATVLAERGVRVTLVEREKFLGGRAGAWTETLASGESFEMER
ncbi:MAG: FAD-dependent oxidoreductase, partial [Gammaproteobacteria bacterium]|nr:FAD-dependent oxidoreductase [Gammaproteobacteria bacterium]